MSLQYCSFYNTYDNYKIKDFTIYGERHTGTKWLKEVISKNFNLPITQRYDHKHFFGMCDWKTLNKAHNTLFIGIIRNPYSWIRGMMKIPYHLKTNDVLNISPWISYNCPKDLRWYDKKYFTDIFDLRYHKGTFLLDYMPYLVDNYIFLRYEDLISTFDEILEIIAKKYNLIRSKCKNNPDRSKLNIYVSKKHLGEINKRTNWSFEQRIGYSKQSIIGVDSNETCAIM
jgi:hypothetical protein